MDKICNIEPKNTLKQFEKSLGEKISSKDIPDKNWVCQANHPLGNHSHSFSEKNHPFPNKLGIAHKFNNAVRGVYDRTFVNYYEKMSYFRDSWFNEIKTCYLDSKKIQQKEDLILASKLVNQKLYQEAKTLLEKKMDVNSSNELQVDALRSWLYFLSE